MMLALSLDARQRSGGMSRSGWKSALALMLSAVLSAQPAFAQGDPIPAPDPNTLRPSQDPARTANGLAMTPPMGWNSWNRFACNINEKIVRDTADAMVTSGMKDAGYEYVVVDDCWHGKRDANGFIT